MGLISVPRLFGELVFKAGENMEKRLNYIFGDASYIREHIATLKSAGLASENFPLVGLYWSSNEGVYLRPRQGVLMETNITFIVAVSSMREANEVRMEKVYEKELYPILEGLVSELENCGLFDFGYSGKASFRYSEGYDAPFHGLIDNTGKDLAELVDHITVKSLKLSLVDDECRINDFINNL